jgi:hypothetical protein
MLAGRPLRDDSAARRFVVRGGVVPRVAPTRRRRAGRVVAVIAEGLCRGWHLRLRNDGGFRSDA